MKKLFILILPAVFLACNSDNHGAKDNKNEVENYPTYDTTQKSESKNKGSEDNSLAEPSNADRNHSTH